MSIQSATAGSAETKLVDDRRPRGESPSRLAAWAYRVATVLLVALMTLSGVLNLARPAPVLESLHHLGYPDYFPIMLGTAKLLGVVALLLPGTRRLKEWAYAGFSFDLLAAVISHMSSHDVLAVQVPVLVALLLLGVSYAGHRGRTVLLDVGAARGAA